MPARIRTTWSNQSLLYVALLLGLIVSGFNAAIVIQPSNTIVYQGDRTYLYCQFSVPPKSTGTTCVWTRGGTYIDMAKFSGIYDWIGDYLKGNCSVQITGADINRDDAQWICQLPATIDQKDGEMSNPAKLSVYKTPTAPTIELDNDEIISINTNLTVKENETQEFTCESHSGNPAPQLSWTLDNLVLKANHEKSEIEDNNKTYKRTSELEMKFSKDDNGKVLRCIMNHVTMNDTSLFVDLKFDVEYETTMVETLSPSYVIVDEGSGYAFTCIADGNPPPTCEWLYQGGDATNWERKSESCIYDIESASYSNEGEYMCLAGNKGMVPSQVITLQLRTTTRNIVALVGGIFGAILIVAIIVLAIVVWRLRRKMKEEAAEQLPDIEALNRGTSENRPKKRDFNSETYMIPMPTQRAPPNPSAYSPTRYHPLIPPRPFDLRARSGSWRRDPESHIYAEPHFYDTIDSPRNAQSDDLNDTLTDSSPKLPNAPPSPYDKTDDGVYLTVTGDNDPKSKESTA